MVMDEELQLAAWGPDLTVAFPTAKDASAFAAGLVRVAVRPCSLAATPAAAVVAQAAAEAALCCAAAAAGKAPGSPEMAGQPLCAGKRKAEAAGLQTPVVRVSRGGKVESWWAVALQLFAATGSRVHPASFCPA